MVWLIFVAGAVLSWGAYGALLHQGQTQLGNPLKALLCVGVAYFLIGVIIPVLALSAQGNLSGFNAGGLDHGDRRRSARRRRRRVHHLGVQDRRAPGLRHAARLRRRAARQRPGDDGRSTRRRRRSTRCSTSASCWRRPAPGMVLYFRPTA